MSAYLQLANYFLIAQHQFKLPNRDIGQLVKLKHSTPPSMIIETQIDVYPLRVVACQCGIHIPDDNCVRKTDTHVQRRYVSTSKLHDIDYWCALGWLNLKMLNQTGLLMGLELVYSVLEYMKPGALGDFEGA